MQWTPKIISNGQQINWSKLLKRWSRVNCGSGGGMQINKTYYRWTKLYPFYQHKYFDNRSRARLVVTIKSYTLLALLLLVQLYHWMQAKNKTERPKNGLWLICKYKWSHLLWPFSDENHICKSWTNAGSVLMVRCWSLPAGDEWRGWVSTE